MSAVAFDTLKYAKRLKEAGFTEQQAEALASAQVDLIEAIATKADIAERLIQAGFTEQQAYGYLEARADALRASHSHGGHL